MNDKIEKEVITLPPFKKFCMTIGELPSSYIETMTYYEMLVWFCNYLGKTVIPTIDNNAEAVIELQNLFIELQTYVNDYFDNLDVQEEINNKLDDMVEQGTLQEIIADYLNSKAIFGFNNVAEMKLSTNLIDGSYARTLGYYEINDGGSSLYKIIEKDNNLIDEKLYISIGDNLMAKLIINDQTINIKQFGVIGDGITDDTNIINYALNLDSNIVKRIYFNEKYLITQPLLVNSNKDLIGIKSNIQSTNYSPEFITNNDITMVSAINKSNILIENINFKHSDNQTADVINITQDRYIKLKNVRIYHTTNSVVNAIAINDTSNNENFTGYYDFENVTCSYYKIGIKSRATYIIINKCNINHCSDYAIWLLSEGIGGIISSNITGEGTAIRYDGTYMLNIQSCYMEGYYINECIENTNNVPINLKGCKIYYRLGTNDNSIIYGDTNDNLYRNTKNSLIDGFASFNNLVINGNMKNNSTWKTYGDVTYLTKSEMEALNIGLPKYYNGCYKVGGTEGNNKLYQLINKSFNKDDIVTVSVWCYVTNASSQAPLVIVGQTEDNGYNVANANRQAYNRPTKEKGKWLLYTCNIKLKNDQNNLCVNITNSNDNECYVTGISLVRGYASNIDCEYTPNEYKVITDNLIFKGSDNKYYKINYDGTDVTFTEVQHLDRI